MTRQKFGQHFLKDERARRNIVAALALSPDDRVIEIGPGHGELTELLATSANLSGTKTKNPPPEAPACRTGGDPPSEEKPKNSLRIVAIEKDPELAEALKQKFEGNPRIEVVTGDALKLLPALVKDLGLKPYKLIGNIPYYITGHLLRFLSEFENPPVVAVFMIQEEVAERIVAAPPRMNRLSAATGGWADPKIIFRVPSGSFFPPPEVDSAVIKLVPRPDPLSPEAKIAYFSAVRALFKQPRKTIANNLGEALRGELVKKNEIEKRLGNLALRPQLRPQDLSREDIRKIGATFFDA